MALAVAMRKELTAASFIFIKGAVGHTIAFQEGWDTAFGRAQELCLLAGARRHGGRHLRGTVHFVTSIRAIFSPIAFCSEGQTLLHVCTCELVTIASWRVWISWSYKNKSNICWFSSFSSHVYSLWDVHRDCWEGSWFWLQNPKKKIKILA